MTATKVQGTALYRESTPGSGTFTLVGGVSGLSPPEMQTDMVETTTLADGTRTRIPTLNNLGDCSFQLQYDSTDATQEQLQADAAAQTARLYRIVGTDGGAAVWAFNAYVSRFQWQAERDGVHIANVTLSPTGAVTRT